MTLIPVFDLMLQRVAQQQALTIYRQAVGDIQALVQWSWKNAHMLALRAERMIYLLETEPARVAFRKLKIRIWRSRMRKHAAKAWAQDRMVAFKCKICQN